MTQSRPRLLGIVALAGATALTLSACVESGRTNNPDSEQEGTDTACPVEVNEDVTTTVRIGYQPIPNGDLVVRDLGWLEACMPNADITWEQFSDGGSVVQAFGSDSVDLALVGSSPGTKALSPPVSDDLQVVWIHDVIGEAESLVVQDSVDATSLPELEGKRVAVPFASTAHYSLLAALDREGMTPSDINLTNLSPDAMLAAWEREEIDAAWVWAPTLPELLDTGSIILSAEDTADVAPTYDLAAATTPFVEENPEFMEIWTAVQNEAVAMIKDDPENAAASVAVQLGIEPEQVLSQFEGYIYLDASEQAGEDYFGGALGQDLINTADFLVTQEEIDEVNPPEQYENAIYTDAIDTVAGQ
ncbi:ABC transporter substrate-binding protein [Ruania albidiflava]|uniref:taurine ABC transporter substrate-binding protein n=1 Tax=Ruania albidiflava TaxID=366586 RepID=UPI0003B4D3F4|nr:ABC transporter substrate-binding protein [Ruania albidiflava]